jgi:NADH-quinone oxidoreductase subunit E
MKRYDLRGYKSGFEARLLEIFKELQKDKAAIFLFETPNDDTLRNVIGKIREYEGDVLNSLRFNEVDWTLVVRAKASNV